MDFESFGKVVIGLRDGNPVKFFESLPHLFAGSVADKVKKGFSSIPELATYSEAINPVADMVIDEAKKNIENKIKSRYNLERVIIGATAFFVVRHIFVNYGDSFFNKS